MIDRLGGSEEVLAIEDIGRDGKSMTVWARPWVVGVTPGFPGIFGVGEWRALFGGVMS